MLTWQASTCAETQRALEDSDVVVVQAKNDARHDANALSAYACDALGVALTATEAFVDALQVARVKALDADEEPAATRRVGQRQQLSVVGDLDRALCDPALAERGEGLEEASGVLAVCDDVVVDEHEVAREAPHLCNHRFQRARAMSPAMERRDGAVAASVGAAAGDLHRVRCDVVTRGVGDEVSPRRGDVAGVARCGATIDAFQPASLKVGQQLGPLPLCVADDHCIEVLRDFIGHEGRMISAGNDHLAARPEGGGDLVGARGQGGHEGDRDQVHVFVAVQGLDILVDQAHGVSRWRERADDRQRHDGEAQHGARQRGLPGPNPHPFACGLYQ